MALVATLLGPVAAPGPAGAQAPDYDAVAPILESRCVLCHVGESAPLGLRLDTLEGILEGSRNGPVVRAGAPAESELLRRIRGTSAPRMPMTGPPWLAEEETATIEAWIAGGLAAGHQPASARLAAPPGRERALPGLVTWPDVAPILATRCAKCHTDGGQMGPPPEGYRLTSYSAAVSRVDRVRVIPRNPGASELVRRIRGHSQPRMPFDGPPWLSEEEISRIEAWIADGARDAEGNPAPVPVGARVRFEGTLTGRWEVDGTAVTVSEGTRIDKSPRPGSRVEVRGRVAADGSIRVERLRRR